MPETRATYEEGLAAGLVALRAQGLEPSDFAKALAVKVAANEITPKEMEHALLAHHRKQTLITTPGR